jgi:hypothetical protein
VELRTRWKCKSTAGGLQDKGLWIAGLQRKINLANLCFLKLVDSLWESKILKRFKPDVVIGPVVLYQNGKSDGYSYSDSRTKFISWNY